MTHSMNEGGLVLRLLFQNFIEEREVSTMVRRSTLMKEAGWTRITIRYVTLAMACNDSSLSPGAYRLSYFILHSWVSS